MRIENNRAYFMRKFDYQEPYLPTPRCRKYRYRPAVGECEISVPVFDSSEAPIAFTHTDGFCENKYRKEYRLYNGALYVRAFNSDFYCLNGEKRRWASVNDLEHNLTRCNYVRDEHYAIVYDYQKCMEILQNTQPHYSIMRDGKSLCIMERAGEPMYCIYTFGLGHNHGGTALSIDNHYNGNISNTRYFSALQYEQARDEALQIAKRRGDNNYFRFIRSKRNRINVLIPSAVTRNPAKDHGDGDPFLNTLYGITEAADSATEAGLLALCVTASAM